jgi:hypothetical protein
MQLPAEERDCALGVETVHHEEPRSNSLDQEREDF